MLYFPLLVCRLVPTWCLAFNNWGHLFVISLGDTFDGVVGSDDMLLLSGGVVRLR